MKKELINNYTGLEVAVIGLSGKFPGAKDIEEFWQNLVEGKELIKFFTEEELLLKGVKSEEIKSNKFIAAHGEMNEGDNFDASFFNYLPNEAKLMDPQIRIYHQCVWEALENSGYNPESFLGRIGLFSGASENITWRAYAILNALGSEVHNFSVDQISNKDFLSTLISYRLNLKGPSINISTACSTSLVAIHTAVRSLLTGECEVAVAGGVSFTSEIKKGYIYEEGMIYSADGHCRAFDEKSTGTVVGDGAGVVVLKKLKDAINDNDNIYAIIKGSSVNNDGLRKVGYTSPSVEGQTECIKFAHKISRVSADSISYIEAHGTATALGDPIEIEALNNVFNNDVIKSCGIGSVKTNIGHLDAAAGVAGFIKVVLALYNKKIPKSLHFNLPNKNIPFDNGPFYIVDELKEWEIKKGMPLRAGVSSFGIGGTNAHVILEEAPKINKESAVFPYNLVTLSAKNEKSLDILVAKFENYLLKTSESLENIAYTLNCGRKDFSFRKSLIVNDLDSLKGSVKGNLPVNYSQNFYDGEFNPIVFMFSGQGTQYLNMSKDLYQSYSEFKSIMDNGFEILKKISKGKDFKKILFNDDDCSELFLSRTDNTQPLLFLVEYSLALYLINLGIEPQYIIGHSLGEYVGACISNVFSFEDGLFMLYHRGRLMNDLPEGDMLSAVIDENKAKELISNDIDIAAVNSVDQCVFSGTKEAIEKLNHKLNELEIVNKIIDTSHAFHSFLMNPILNEFEAICKKIHFNSPKFKIISNISGKIISDEEINNHIYWRDHITSSVMFNKGLSNFFSDNKKKIFIEIGPGSTLLNLVGHNTKSKELIKAKIPSLPNKKSELSSCFTLVRLLENLWQLGIQINWKYYYSDRQVYKLPLPTYPFSKKKYPAEVDPFSNFNEIVSVIPKKELVLNSFYQQAWTNVIFPECNINNKDDSLCYLIFTVGLPVFDEIKELLKKRKTSYVQISLGKKFKKVSKFNYQVCGTELKEMNDLFNELKKDNISYSNIIYGWGLENDMSEDLFLEDISLLRQFKSFDFLKILNLAKSLDNQNLNSNIKLAYLSNNFQQILPGEKSNYKYATSLGLLKSFSMENDFVTSFSLDIDNLGNYAKPILNELHNEEFNFNIAYRNKTRWIQEYKKISLNTNFNLSLEVVKKDGVYVISGGLGKVGRVFCNYLASDFDATVILLGRSVLPEFSDWDRLINDSSTAEITRNKLKFLIDMKNLNYKVEYHNVDISDVLSLENLITKMQKKYVRINGVIHAAGIVNSEESYKNILNTDMEFMLPHFKSKAFGLLNFYKIFKGKKLDFVWTTTSLSTVVGGHSLGAYLASNLYADYFISSIEEYEPNWKSVNLDGLDLESKKSDSNIDRGDLINIFNTSLNIKQKSSLIVSMTDLHVKIKTINERVKSLSDSGIKYYKNEDNDRSSMQAKYVKPNSETEKKLTILWENFFGINKIGIDDSFFELGGDSLKSMTIIKRMFKEFNVDIALQDFIEKGTIRELSIEINLAIKLKEISENNIEEGGGFNEMII